MGEPEIARSKSFDAHLNLSPPSHLYHYTTQSGLLGILSSGELQASKVQYFDDATDFWFAFEIAMERINHWKSRPSEGSSAGRLSALVARLPNTVTTNLFAACFCENGDLLSQWRGFSGSKYGYSLGVETARLSAKAKEFRFELGKCIYDREIQRGMIDELIRDAVESEGRFGSDLDRAVAFERGLLRIGAFFKHEKFADEKEWRILSPVTESAPPGIAFRMGPSMPTPYCGFPLGAEGASAVRRAFLGPCPHPLLAKAAVEMMFTRYRLSPEGPGICNSSIPFRNW